MIEKYPEFRQIYEEGYEICRNTERVMEMFSKELYELDRNTVQYMMDEQQERIDAQQEEIDAQQEEINAQRETIETQQETIESQKEMIAGMQEEAIKGTVHILRNVNIPEQEIITQICNQYRIREEEAKRYLQ